MAYHLLGRFVDLCLWAIVLGSLSSIFPAFAKKLNPAYEMKPMPEMKPMKAKYFPLKDISPPEKKGFADTVIDKVGTSVLTRVIGGPVGFAISAGSKLSNDGKTRE